MIHHRAGVTVPTDQDIAAAFKKIENIIPEDQVKTILQAREGIGGLLGFCLAIFEAYQKLDLVIAMDTHQKELKTSIETLQAAKDNLEKSLEVAENNHLMAINNLYNKLENQKTTTANEKAILDAEIQGLQKEKTILINDLAEKKRIFETEAVVELQAKNNEIVKLNEEIATAQTQLAKVQKSIANLRSKLE
jgi:chromosome segregation ATPase